MKKTHGRSHFTPETCFGCQVLTLSIQPTSGLQPHFNYAVGRYVNNDREFRDALKRRGEQNSRATGLDTNYEPRYPGETSPIREADGVFDDTARNIRALNA
jgi:hypothetical protein